MRSVVRNAARSTVEINFVLDCGSSDMTCATGNVLHSRFILPCSLKSFGICKLGLAGILFCFHRLFRISQFPEPNTMPSTQLVLNETFYRIRWKDRVIVA